MPAFDQQINFFSMTPYQPYKEPHLTSEINVQFPPNTTIAKGTVIGQVAAAASDVQTFTATGTPTGGTFTFAVTNPLTGTTSNLVIPFNATSSALQTLATAIYGAGNITAGGGAWPGTPLTLTGAGSLLNTPIPVATAGANALTGGSTPTATVAHTTTGATLGTYNTYVNAGAFDPARAITKYDVATDANGNVLGQWGQTYTNMPVYVRGVFRTLTLVGWDSGARGDLAAHLESGSDADGVVRIGC